MTSPDVNLYAIEKYKRRVEAVNSLLCIGLDSDYTRLPDKFKASLHPQFMFNKWIIDQTHEYVSAYKPNIAFYEARGEQGLHDLKLTVDYLKSNYPGILTICDAKRADIGSTNNGYVTSVFDYMGFDAITLQPYLGGEALAPFLSRKEKANIILVRTSNPGSGELQNLIIEGKPLWMIIAEKVRDRWNENDNCMLVMGATYPEEIRQLRAIMPGLIFLVPGIGAQGGNIEQTVRWGTDNRGGGLIINSSRGIIFSDDPATSAMQLRDVINEYR